ncbi:hypothetical protein CSKR_112479 [Clonorchis sinensis]|uniref:Uncharacterized protein n=1 Tax=Clonorchis sinensis TaxID=79923 RepID=A0A419PGZ4_CLOSI|nr:hypothetical protein CSKR_112479 [Clonorchis sinensis]
MVLYKSPTEAGPSLTCSRKRPIPEKSARQKFRVHLHPGELWSVEVTYQQEVIEVVAEAELLEGSYEELRTLRLYRLVARLLVVRCLVALSLTAILWLDWHDCTLWNEVPTTTDHRIIAALTHDHHVKLSALGLLSFLKRSTTSSASPWIVIDVFSDCMSRSITVHFCFRQRLPEHRGSEDIPAFLSLCHRSRNQIGMESVGTPDRHACCVEAFAGLFVYCHTSGSLRIRRTYYVHKLLEHLLMGEHVKEDRPVNRAECVSEIQDY